MKAQVALRHDAGAAVDFVHLRMLADNHAHTPSNGGAIAFGSHQLDLDPVLLVASIIAKQRWRIVHVQDEGVDVAVVVVVAEGGAAAGKMLGDAGSHFRRYVFEAAIAEIPVNESRILVSLAEAVVINLRVDVSVDLNDVWPAIVVVVDKATAPRYIAIVDADAGGEGDIAEGSVAVVVVQVAGVIGEVGFEDVEPAVAVVVGHGDTHSGLLVPVFTIGAAGHYGDIGEGAVMVVLEENAGFGVYGDVNVRPPVVVEIVRDGGDGVSRAGLENAGFLGNIGKGAVSIVVVEDVRIARKAARAAHGGNALPLAVAGL